MRYSQQQVHVFCAGGGGVGTKCLLSLKTRASSQKRPSLSYLARLPKPFLNTVQELIAFILTAQLPNFLPPPSQPSLSVWTSTRSTSATSWPRVCIRPTSCSASWGTGRGGPWARVSQPRGERRRQALRGGGSCGEPGYVQGEPRVCPGTSRRDEDPLATTLDR